MRTALCLVIALTSAVAVRADVTHSAGQMSVELLTALDWMPGTARYEGQPIQNGSATNGPVIRLPDVRERMMAMGFEATETTVQEFDAFTKADVARWTKVVREARIQPE